MMRAMSRGALALVQGALLVALLVIGTVRARADNAPMVPTTSRTCSRHARHDRAYGRREVDVKVTERDGAVHALVTASFDMFNRGPTVSLITGFPKYSGGGYFVPGGFAGFDPTQFSNFQASSGATIFQLSVQPVKPSTTADRLGTADWYVWQMKYPANQTTNVQVSYDQTLAARTNGYTYVSYVLRTGALWDGSIGAATVSMTADGGGTFLVPSPDELRQAFGTDGQSVPNPEAALPTTSTPTRLTWQLSDLKPTFDPFAYYIPADPSARLASTQARLTQDAPSSTDYAAAVTAFFDAVGRDDAGLPLVVRHRVPEALKSRYEQAADWAAQGTTLDPNNAAAFLALGDNQFVREVQPTLYISCRPQLAPVSYQTAIDLGSQAAQARLDDITTLILQADGRRHACSMDPNHPVPDPLPDTLTSGVRTEILAAIDRANLAWTDTTGNLNPSELQNWVAGKALADDQAEIAKLQQAHQRRGNTKLAFDVLDVNLDTPGRAIVHTRETWSAQIMDMATYKVLQQIPPTTYIEIYVVEFMDGGWIVTDNQT